MKTLLAIVTIIAAPMARAADFHFDYAQGTPPTTLEGQTVQQALETAATRHCRRLYRQELSLQGVRRCKETIVREVLRQTVNRKMTAQAQKPDNQDKG